MIKSRSEKNPCRWFGCRIAKPNHLPLVIRFAGEALALDRPVDQDGFRP